MPLLELSSSTTVVRNPGFMEAEVDEEIVALNIEKGICYGLNPVGSRIWRMLANPIRVADICKALVDEYQVDPETCEREVLELLVELRAEDMIGTPADSVPEVGAKGGT
jgi:Coenzyme PQQ synthesis protein D (PqqD)